MSFSDFIETLLAVEKEREGERFYKCGVYANI